MSDLDDSSRGTSELGRHGSEVFPGRLVGRQAVADAVILGPRALRDLRAYLVLGRGLIRGSHIRRSGQCRVHPTRRPEVTRGPEASRIHPPDEVPAAGAVVASGLVVFAGSLALRSAMRTDVQTRS